MKIKKIAIIGLGLMGGSLAAQCRKAFPRAEIVGVTRSQAALKQAKRKKWIHSGISRISNKLCDVDLVIICTPVNFLPVTLKSLDQYLRPKTLVTDVGSVKGAAESSLSRLKLKNIQFVGAHPMVGSHKRGIQAASKDLYNSGFTFLVKSGRTDKKAYLMAKRFWKKISPAVVEVSPKKHDAIVSEISHLPHIAAVCLIAATQGGSFKYAAKGFLDTTRIAAGDASVWAPIFQANQKAVWAALSRFEAQMRSFKRALKSSKKSPQKLKNTLEKASKKRLQISL